MPGPLWVVILALLVSGLPSLADDPTEVLAAAPGDTEGPGFDADAQEAKLEAIHNGSADTDTLKAHLRDRDPVIASAALQVLSEGSQREAMEAVLQVIDDSTAPVRFQVFQLLLAAPDPDQAVVARALRAALKDPDSALVVRAIQELAARDDPESVGALMDAQREGDVELRLSIVKWVGSGDNAERYIANALGDSDARVRKAAEAVLLPSNNDQ